MEVLIYGRKFASQNRLGYPYSWKAIDRFCMLCFTLYLRVISKYKPPGGLYLEGRINGGFFCVTSLGAYIYRGLYMEGLIFGILRYHLYHHHYYYYDIQ